MLLCRFLYNTPGVGFELSQSAVGFYIIVLFMQKEYVERRMMKTINNREHYTLTVCRGEGKQAPDKIISFSQNLEDN